MIGSVLYCLAMECQKSGIQRPCLEIVERFHQQKTLCGCQYLPGIRCQDNRHQSVKNYFLVSNSLP